ncbi:hypothetical protein YC2023_113278 [Brassica napus]
MESSSSMLSPDELFLDIKLVPLKLWSGDEGLFWNTHRSGGSGSSLLRRCGRDAVTFTGGSRKLHRRIEAEASPTDRDGASPADRDGNFIGTSMRIEITSSTRIFGGYVQSKALWLVKKALIFDRSISSPP